MIIRPLREDEYPLAEALMKERCPEMGKPPKVGLVGRFVDGELVAVAGVGTMAWVGPVVGKGAGDATELISWIDGKLDPYEYIFFVEDSNAAMNRLVAMRYGDCLTPTEGTMYTRKR